MANRKAGQGSKWLHPATHHAIYHRDDDRCAYCGASEADGAILTVDHIVACELGGTNAHKNLVTCCLSCNSAKQHLTMRGWLHYLRHARGFTTTQTTTISARVRRLAAKPLDRAEGRRRVAERRAA